MWALSRQQPTILDMNDRGELLIKAEAWYIPLAWEGWIEGYILKYAILNPSH
jgi:hypothetical protein